MKNPGTLATKLSTIDSARRWLIRADQALKEPTPDEDTASRALELAAREIANVLAALKKGGAR